MKQELKNAYERMNPPPGAKERMMRNILNRKKEEKRYIAEPTPSHSWSAIPALLALVAVLAVGWWMLQPDADLPLSDDPVETTAPSEFRAYLDIDEMFPNVPEKFGWLLLEYYAAQEGNWTQTQWQEAGFSTDLYQIKDKANWGYACVDLDGNGVEELLICTQDQIYGLYAMVDGTVSELLGWRIESEATRLSMELSDDNVVYICQLTALGDIYHSYYRLGKDGLGATALIMDAVVIEAADGTWYTGPNEKDAMAVSSMEAQAVMDRFLPVVIEANWIAENGIPESIQSVPGTYRSILMKYYTAVQENWDAARCEAADISPLITDYAHTSDWGYCLMDLDGNRVEELVLTDGEQVLDIFTVIQSEGAAAQHPEAVHLAMGWKTNRLYICEGNLILQEQEEDADHVAYLYYRLENNIDLVPVKAVIYGADAKNGPWFVGDTQDSAEPATSSDAQAVFDAYVREYLEFTPLIECRE